MENDAAMATHHGGQRIVVGDGNLDPGPVGNGPEPPRGHDRTVAPPLQ